MCYRNSEFDMTHPFPAHLLLCHLYAATVADDTTVADSLVLSAVALVVLCRTEDLLAEETVTLRLVCPVVDGFWLQYFSRRPLLDVFWGSKSYADPFEIAFNLVFFIKSRHISIISIVSN